MFQLDTDGTLLINLTETIYNKKDEFFPWLAKQGDIKTIHLFGYARLTHLIAFIDQFGLLIRKELVERIILFASITKPTFDKHRKLRNIFAEYTGLKSVLISPPYIIESIVFTEEQMANITELDITINDIHWLDELPKFKSLRKLLLKDVELTGRRCTGQIAETLLKLTSLTISINLFKLFNFNLSETGTIEHLRLIGQNSVDSLFAFFLKLPALKTVALDVVNFHEILPMLNNSPNLINVTIKGDDVLTLFVTGKLELSYPFIDTMLSNQSVRDLRYGCSRPKIGPNSYQKLRELIKRGLTIKDKILNPLYYQTAVKLVEHGYKLDSDCFCRIIDCENINSFKHRCKLLKHFAQPFDIKDFMEGLTPEKKAVLTKIDL